MNKIIFGSVFCLMIALVSGCNSVRPTGGVREVYLTNLSPGKVNRPKPFSLRDQLPRDDSQFNVSFHIFNMTDTPLHFFDGSIVEVGKSMVIEGLNRVRDFLSVLENGPCGGEEDGHSDGDKLYLEAKVTSCEH
ncbi:MAG: hypothetical protein BWK78_02520 [Thiotrichaceae bacterium IS1]|nr:MAG: hypothetical protein BWK78_02520 [Thiotrichaceae bacterium IS1]